MSIICKNCGLNDNIYEYRIKLSNLISETRFNLIDQEVVILSQFLDELLVKCIICKKRAEVAKSMNLDEINATHASFYYYSA